MSDKAKHIACAGEALAIFQQECGTTDEDAIADLICDLGHIADARGLDFLGELKRGVRHWIVERRASGGDVWPDAIVDITVNSR